MTDGPFELSRRKARHPLSSVLYRCSAMLIRLVGRERYLGWLLDIAWVTRRIAWEQSDQYFGPIFHNQAMGLNEGLLREVIQPDDHVLDVGCGRGEWTEIAARFASNVTGVDEDPRKLALASDVVTSPNVSLVRADICEWNAPKKYDLALLIQVLEHVDEPVPFLTNLRALSRKVLIEVPDFESDSLNRPRLWLSRPFYGDADHVREYTRESLEKQLQQADWTLLETWVRGGTIVVLGSC